jgi:hypothetical protein
MDVTLILPDVTKEYPDMVAEGWKLTDALDFITEYKLKIQVQDSAGNTIPEEAYSDFSNKTITYQSRPLGDPIVEGVTLKVKVNGTYTAPEETE